MKQLSTELQDRVLRYDGVSLVPPEMVARALLLGVQPTELRVVGDCWDIQQFNANVAAEDELSPAEKAEPVQLSFRWQLPQKYLDMDLATHVCEIFGNKCEQLYSTYTKEEYDAAPNRVALELQEIERRGMVEFMKTIVYVLDVFRETGVVWGVGRGSSCASYILFLLGLHSVDCIRYDVPMEEFFHD